MDIKVRYALKSKESGDISFIYYGIEEIETDPQYRLFDLDMFEIIGRDLYTGFKDKNNNEMFNNDIIKYGSGKPMVIKHKITHPSSTIGHGISINEKISGWTISDYHGDYDTIERIGNVYKNPEVKE